LKEYSSDNAVDSFKMDGASPPFQNQK
jgi:hypothetical protein